MWLSSSSPLLNGWVESSGSHGSVAGSRDADFPLIFFSVEGSPPGAGPLLEEASLLTAVFASVPMLRAAPPIAVPVEGLLFFSVILGVWLAWVIFSSGM